MTNHDSLYIESALGARPPRQACGPRAMLVLDADPTVGRTVGAKKATQRENASLLGAPTKAKSGAQIPPLLWPLIRKLCSAWMPLWTRSALMCFRPRGNPSDSPDTITGEKKA